MAIAIYFHHSVSPNITLYEKTRLPNKNIPAVFVRTFRSKRSGTFCGFGLMPQQTGVVGHNPPPNVPLVRGSMEGIFTTWLPHVSILYIMVSLRKLSLKLENAHKKPSKNRFPFQIHLRFSIHFSLMSSPFPKEGPLLVINGMYEYEGPIKRPHSTWTTGVFVTPKSGVK